VKALTKTFNVNYYSEVEEKEFEGVFVVRKLTIGDRIQMGAMSAEMLGGQTVATNTDAFAYAHAVSHCRVALITKPGWFEDPTKLNDEQLFTQVYKEMQQFEASFRRVPASGNEQEGSRPNPAVQNTVGSPQSYSPVEGAGRRDGSSAPLVGKQIPLVTKVG
jgi:hypothetical protein